MLIQRGSPMRTVQTGILNSSAFRMIRAGAKLLLGCAVSMAQAQFTGPTPPAQPAARSSFTAVNPFSQQDIGSPAATRTAPLLPFQPGIDLYTARPNLGAFSTGTGIYGPGARLAIGSSQLLGSFAPAARNLTAPPFGAEPSGRSASAGSSLFGPPARGVLSLNDLFHGSSSPRTGSPFGPARVPQGSFLSGVGFTDSAQFPPSSLLMTSDLGNGVLFSAGTGGSHSMVGAPAAGLSSSAGAKRSNPAVNLKLSF